MLLVRTSLGGLAWEPDVRTALLDATGGNKIVVLDFTGSDWCGWCMKLKSEVFDQPEFAAYAKDNLLMVEVDFPRHKELPAEQQASNQKLAETYGIRGYPTIILLDAMGNKIGQSGYVPGGPKNFIASLEKFPAVGHREVAPPVASAPEASRHAAPAFVPVAPASPNHYGDLVLKAISGAKDSRMVMINDQLLTIGETAKVKVHDERIAVTLKEVHDDSVLIVVAGKTQELRLGQH